MKTILFVLTAAAVLISSNVFADLIPEDVLQLRSGIYAVSDNVGSVGGEGITVEAWAYFNNAPPDRLHEKDPNGHWVVFGKPGSYYVTMTSRNLDDAFDVNRPAGSATINFGTEREHGEIGWETGVRGHGIPRDSYRKWVHIAFQIAPSDVEGMVMYYIFFKQRWVGSSGSPAPMGSTNSPFVVGGPTPDAGRGIWKRTTSMEGYVDEVRISEGMVYPIKPGEPFEVERPFLRNDLTIALWHFEDGSGLDSSGNGNTLEINSSPAGVERQGTIAVLWGNLKN